MKAQRVFRIFVSSTFGDFQAEREALQARVWPALQDFCRAHGASFQAVDLRWGVSESAELEHETMRICLDEIAHCQRLSPRPNFLVLVGDRYGWRPTPAAIPAGEFERILEHYRTDAAAQELLRFWYWRDDNAVPAEYVLQPRRGEYARDAAAWSGVERQLLEWLRAAAIALNLPPARYFYSATHLEIVHGALDPGRVPEATAQVLACFRRLEGLPTDGAGEAGRFENRTADGARDADAEDYLAQLRADLRARLAGQGWVRDYTARWTGTAPWGITTDHLEPLCRDVEAGLRALLEQELRGDAEGDVVARERDAHQAFAEERGAVFVGREALRAQIAGYLTAPPGPAPSPGVDPGGRKTATKPPLTEDGVPPLLVHGPGGVGKSALLARVWLQTEDGWPGAVRVARFIGATPDSVDARSLLAALCRELARAYGQDETLPEGGFQELMDAFAQRLAFATAERPLWLLLDAVDQLVEHGGEAPYAWLPGSLPPGVRLVVSVLDGPAGDIVQHRLPGARRLPVPPVGDAEAEAMLDAQLAVATPTQPARRLTPDQRRAVLTGLRGSGLPLWLTVAVAVARRGRSYDPARALAADLTTLLDQRLLAGLEKRHGPVLVRRALGALLASRYGLSDEELRDVLWRNPAVRAEFEARQHPDQPPVNALPPVLWSRLYFELEPYLRVRRAQGVPCYGFFHRQIGVSFQALCLPADQAPACHAHLAGYFQDQGYRDAARRPRLRTLAELPWQLAQAGQGAELEALLTDFDFAMAKCEAGLAEDLREDYRRALAVLAPPSPAFRLWENFFRSRQHLLRRAEPAWPAPRILLQLAVEHADESPVTQAAERWLDQGHCDWVWLRNPQRVTAAEIDPCTVLLEGENVEGVQLLPDGRLLSWGDNLRIWDLKIERCLLKLTKYTHFFKNVKILTDGRILSWDDQSWSGNDNALRLWDGERGVLLSLLMGHTRVVRGATELTDGQILSWSEDGTLRLWDRMTGNCIAVLAGHMNWVEEAWKLRNGGFFSWSFDGARLWEESTGKNVAILVGHMGSIMGFLELMDGQLLSWSRDRTLRLWNGKRCVLVLAGHTGRIEGVRELANGCLLSWSRDKTLRLWDKMTGKCTAVLEGHMDWVINTLDLLDGRILSWSRDRTLRLWNGSTGMCISVLKEHTGEIKGALKLRDGQLLSWSEDKTLCLWDGETGAHLTTLVKHTNEIKGILELQDGRLLSWSQDRTLRLWSNLNRASQTVLVGHIKEVQGIQKLKGDQLLSWSQNILYLWDYRSGACQIIFEGHKKFVIGASELKSSRLLSWSEDEILLWDKLPGECAIALTGHTDKIEGVCELAEGRLLSWSQDRVIRIWDGASGKCIAVLTGHTDKIENVFELAEGRLLSWSQDKKLRLWDEISGKCLAILAGHTDRIEGVCKLAGGRLLSWSRDKTLRLWDGASKKCVAVLAGHTNRIEGVCKLAGGQLLSWSQDKTLRLWDGVTGSATAVLTGHRDRIKGVLELRGNRLLSWSKDKTLRLWNSSSGAFLKKLVGHTRGVLGAKALEDERILSWAGDHTLRLWDGITGHCLAVLERIQDCSPPTGGFAAASGGYAASLLNVNQMTVIARWQGNAVVQQRGEPLDEGILIVSLASGHVFCLQLYRGNRRIGLAELTLP